MSSWFQFQIPLFPNADCELLNSSKHSKNWSTLPKMRSKVYISKISSITHTPCYKNNLWAPLCFVHLFLLSYALKTSLSTRAYFRPFWQTSNLRLKGWLMLLRWPSPQCFWTMLVWFYLYSVWYFSPVYSHKLLKGKLDIMSGKCAKPSQKQRVLPIPIAKGEWLSICGEYHNQ